VSRVTGKLDFDGVCQWVNGIQAKRVLWHLQTRPPLQSLSESDGTNAFFAKTDNLGLSSAGSLADASLDNSLLGSEFVQRAANHKCAGNDRVGCRPCVAESKADYGLVL
jgi:hypothetical protein